MTPATEVMFRQSRSCPEPLVVPRTLVVTPHIMSNSMLLKQSCTQSIVLLSILVGAPTVASRVWSMVMLYMARTVFRTVERVREARIVARVFLSLPVFRNRDIMILVFMVTFRSNLTSRKTGELSELMVVSVPSFIKPFMTTELVAPHSRRSTPFRTSGIEKSRTSP